MKYTRHTNVKAKQDNQNSFQAAEEKREEKEKAKKLNMIYTYQAQACVSKNQR